MKIRKENAIATTAEQEAKKLQQKKKEVYVCVYALLTCVATRANEFEGTLTLFI